MGQIELSESTEAALAAAAAAEGSQALDTSARIDFLLSAYAGYKGAYHQAVAERAGYLGQISTLAAERDGYKAAYESIGAEHGVLRSIAAPVARRAEQHAAAAGKPSIFLVTLPKSGTVYVSHSLAQTLGYDHTSTLVTPTFPKNILWGEMLLDFAKGGMVSASHMQPDDENVRMMQSAGVTRGILHLRDPRPALQSWIHFIRSKSGLLHALIGRRDYHGLTLAEQTDHMIDHAFRSFAEWIEMWCDVLDRDPSLDFLVLMHDDLARDEVTYFRRIMDFYGLAAEVHPVAKSSQTHFRKGDNDDWRVSFTPEQRRRVNELMPPRLWQRFGWLE